MNLSGKKVTVVGFGKSGMADSSLLCARGALVTVIDIASASHLRESISQFGSRAAVKLQLGPEMYRLPQDAELVVISPGVPASSEPVKAAQQKGLDIYSEIELAFRFCSSPVVAVTGTNGKTTTVMLLERVLGNSGLRPVLAGNVATPFSEAVTESGASIFVVEVSSFQLENVSTFRPHIALILNIAEDHLDRYKTMNDYAGAKARIFLNQREDNFLILNADDGWTPFFRERASLSRVIPFSRKMSLEEGVFLSDDRIIARLGGTEQEVCRIGDIRLKGAHNIENVLACVTAALLCKCEAEKIKEAICSFEDLPHRLEFVRELNGISFYNDSKATNVSSAISGVLSFDSSVVLIAGGKDKGCDFAPMQDVCRKKVKRAVLFGETAQKLRGAITETPAQIAVSMKEAVEAAYVCAEAGDTVLLAPAASSFDMFRAYDERGDIFKETVSSL